jgi:hypothetical protein
MIEIPPLSSDIRWLALFAVEDIQKKLTALQELLALSEDEEAAEATIQINKEQDNESV